MIMAYFNEDNVTEQMCIAVAKINYFADSELLLTFAALTT